MQFYIMLRTYDSFGGHPFLGPFEDYLLSDAEDFGPALSELTVTFHVPHSGPPKPSLEELYAEFHAKREMLPKVIWRRKRGQAVIDVASDLFDGKDMYNVRNSPTLFRQGATETVNAIALLRERLTTRDDFRLDAFLSHCRERQSRLPTADDALAAVIDACAARQELRRAAMSSWEKLGIDWRDYHPQARVILDDPFYWEQFDDFAPHGNDTGADLLASYREWLRRDPAGDPVAFCERLLHRWGVSDDDSDAIDNSRVALAFAELKLRGECRSEAIALARHAIQRQRAASNAAVDWPHREERLRRLDMLEAKLNDGNEFARRK